MRREENNYSAMYNLRTGHLDTIFIFTAQKENNVATESKLHSTQKRLSTAANVCMDSMQTSAKAAW